MLFTVIAGVEKHPESIKGSKTTNSNFFIKDTSKNPSAI
ncbi:hypothetical protein BTHERMOSOX_1850 [Bathymodiolus thermophilus thioautotrophic gill symbiont]|nr:hypothetical protein BTHERMOSOX_1850 [Bathymodiolus thermophilus thioautotrophic gill symbiont]